MPISACIRAVLPSLTLAIAASVALAGPLQDCRDAALASEVRQSACKAAAAEAESHEILAFTHLDAGRPEDALIAARRAVEIASDLPEEASYLPGEAPTSGHRIMELAQGVLLQALAETGAVDEAIAAYREALAAGIDDGAGYLANGLASGLYREGEHEKALPIIAEWLAANPEPMGEHHHHSYEILDTAAHIMAATGQADDAVNTFLRAAEIGGTGWRVLYKLQLTTSGFAPGNDEDSFEAALRACVATGEACKLS
jgi:tetratricopeptide (TPR) repeat protein